MLYGILKRNDCPIDLDPMLKELGLPSYVGADDILRKVNLQDIALQYQSDDLVFKTLRGEEDLKFWLSEIFITKYPKDTFLDLLDQLDIDFVIRQYNSSGIYGKTLFLFNTLEEAVRFLYK